MIFKKMFYKRLIAFALVAAVGLSPMFSLDAKAADGQNMEAQADSWRYSDGQILNEEEANANAEEEMAEVADDADKNAQLGSQSEEGRLSSHALNAMATGKYQYGIDVSYWQKDIDWAKVKASGVDFAIIRCGYGLKNSDSYFRRNVQGCLDNGIAYGVYFYSYATSTANAKTEANYTIELLKGLSPDLPVYYDLEDNKVKNAGDATIKQIAQTYCAAIEAAGYNAGVYANLDWWNNRIQSAADGYDKWVAQWASSCSYSGSYSMWQCSSNAKISGISGRVDENWIVSDEIFFGNEVTPSERYIRLSVTSKTGPNIRYADSTHLSWGELVTVTGTYGCYVKIKNSEGTVSWINSSYLATPDSPKEFVLEDGKMVLKSYAGDTLRNQWAVVADKTYYVDGEGVALTGLQTLNGQEYYFGNDGVAQSFTFMEIGGRTCYLGQNGLIMKNTSVKIGGYVYGFDSNGEMIKNAWAWTGNVQYYYDTEGRAYINKSKAKKKVTVYRNPGSSKAGKVKKNKKFYIMRTSGKWSQMDNGLWIKTSDTKKTSVYPKVNPSQSACYKAKMKKKYGAYTGPSTSYIKKKTYKKNRKVKVVGLYGSWAKLSTGYWVPKSKLK